MSQIKNLATKKLGSSVALRPKELTEDDVWRIRSMVNDGNIDQAKAFIENKGLKWLT